MRHPYRMVIRALPSEYRRMHGDELIDTALALNNGAWSFREAALLLTHGLRTRAVAATAASRRIAASQAIITTIELIAIGLVVIMTAWLFRVDGPFATYETKRWMIPLVVLTAGALVSRRPRLVVVAATVLTFAAQFGVRWPHSDRDLFALAIISQAVVIAVAGVWTLNRADVRTHAGPSAAALVILAAIGIFAGPIALGNLLTVGLLAGIAFGLVVAWWDPRLLLIAVCAVVWNQAVAWPFVFFGQMGRPAPSVLALQFAIVAALVIYAAVTSRRLRLAI